VVIMDLYDGAGHSHGFGMAHRVNGSESGSGKRMAFKIPVKPIILDHTLGTTTGNFNFSYI